MPEFSPRRTGRWLTIWIVLATGLTAVIFRLPWLASAPPGFALAEAETALQVRDATVADLPLLPRTIQHVSHGSVAGGDSQAPLFSWLLWLSGTLGGWDVASVRLPATLLGIVAAVGCALWYRSARGPLAGLLGGLLAATALPLLVLSRQAQPAIGAAALAALGLWCLWEGLGPVDDDRRRSGGWLIAAGLNFGLGLYAHPTLLPALVVVPLAGAFLVWRAGIKHRSIPDWRWLAAGLGCLFLIAAPLVVSVMTEPDGLSSWLEQDWNGDRRTDQLGSPLDIVTGYGDTLLALGWDGHDSPLSNRPGRPLLDPLLAILTLTGLVIALRHPLDPLHGLTLLWLAAFSLPNAALDPGNPALLMPILPALLLLPLLALTALTDLVRQHGSRVARLATGLVALAMLGSSVWSLADYRRWSGSDTTYAAFDGALYDALAAAADLPDDGLPIYIGATTRQQPLLAYLAPASQSPPADQPQHRLQRAIDSRSTLVIPEKGNGYLVYPSANAPALDLQALLDGQPPIETGQQPDGDIAWQIRLVGPPVRERLPWTLPAIGFQDGFQLVGFAIRPDLGEVATTGRLPDPPRVSVTLVWSVPGGATPHTARVRLLPTDPSILDPEAMATAAEVTLTASLPIAAGNRGRELVVVHLSVPVPDSPDLIVEVQAGLTRADGTILAPTAGPNAAGDYALLNRVQYLPDRDATP